MAGKMPAAVLAGLLLSSAAPIVAQVTQQELQRIEERHRRMIERLEQQFNQKVAGLEARIRELESAPSSRPSAEDAELERLVAEAELESSAAHEAVQGAMAQGGPGILNALNPRITLFADLLLRAVSGTLRNEDGEDVGDRFSLRETELDFRADIDPFAKAVFIFALEEESPGQFDIAPEEVYATFETLPLNLRGKAGRFRTSFGANNLLHTHDLPQSDRPLTVRAFLGEEGDIQNGAGLEWLVPGMEEPTLTISYQVLNGENDTVLAGEDADHLAHLVRMETFLNTSASSWIRGGMSALIGRADPSFDDDSVLLGGDLTFKWRPADQSQLETSLVLQAEGFYLRQDRPGGTVSRGGAYGMILWQVDRSWYLGARGDWTEFPDEGTDGWSASAWVSYYTSEFLRLRLGLEYVDVPDQDVDWILFLQLTFVIGSHPAEPFWVNR